MSPLTIAIAPVAFLLIYIYEKDVIAKEPKKELIKAFVGGAIGTVVAVGVFCSLWLALFFEAETWENPILSAFGQAFIEAAIPEEFFKFLVLYLLVWKSKDFDENFDGIVYAVFVSMGFACTENIMYVLVHGTGVGFLRAFTAVPGHFFFAVIMGYYFSLAKFSSHTQKKTRTNLTKAFVFAMLAHGIYDMILFLLKPFEAEEDPAVGIILLIVLVFFVFNFFLWRQGFKRIKELVEMDLAILPDNHPRKPNYMKNKNNSQKYIPNQRPNPYPTQPTNQRPNPYPTQRPNPYPTQPTNQIPNPYPTQPTNQRPNPYPTQPTNQRPNRYPTNQPDPFSIDDHNKNLW